MVFTQEDETAVFKLGEPIDLFFLFDASASQDSEITRMLDSAKDIVKMFAGDEKSKDTCHVGSALYLGPTVRMMCSAIWDTLSQTVWQMTTSKKDNYRSGYVSNAWALYPKLAIVAMANSQRAEASARALAAVTPDKHIWEPNEAQDKSAYKGWKKYWDKDLNAPPSVSKLQVNDSKGSWLNGTVSKPLSYLSGTGANKKPSGFEAKLADYVANKWMMTSQDEEE